MGDDRDFQHVVLKYSVVRSVLDMELLDNNGKT